MKSIAVVTTGAVLGDFLRNNLEKVFGEDIIINNYFWTDLEDVDEITDDVVLVMTKSYAVNTNKYVANSQKIIVAQRTIKTDEIYKIFALPENTKVLVVNDDSETTLETVSLLYQIGFNHLNLIPYEPGVEYSDIKIAITPGARDKVPSNIKTIIDVGNRYIDISTFIKIINMLGIDNQAISKRLIQYSDKIVTLDVGIKKQYKDLFLKNVDLDNVINLSNEGILSVNNQGEITLCNKRLKDMFDITENAIGRKVTEIFLPEVIKVLSDTEANDMVLEYKNRSLVVTKKKIEYFGEVSGTYINFQEVTYIKQLEQNLSRKLKDSGLLARYHFDDITTQSPHMLACIKLAERIARADLTVLITGESGTGKELLAHSIHNASKREKYPFVAVNCAAVPESLLESELFGYEGGSFTGALREGKIGLFEQANNGTIFLDEVGDMPLMLQARLLRVLQERQVMRIGSHRVININIRVIAATNQNLLDKVHRGVFREDLFYRLNVLPLSVPSLADRREDILLLLQNYIRQSGGGSIEISNEAQHILRNYNWPGNIRELQNVASYIAYIIADTVTASNLPSYLTWSIESFERQKEVLVDKYDLAKAKHILEIMADYGLLSKGVGRNHIQRVLEKKGVNLSEGEVRRLLGLLAEMGLVTSQVGRRGSEITSKGKNFLNWLKNG